MSTEVQLAPRDIAILGHEGRTQWPVNLGDVIGAAQVETEATNNLLYRSIYPKLRKLHIEALVEATGLKLRATDAEGKKFPTDQKAENDLRDQFVERAVADGSAPDAAAAAAQFKLVAQKCATKVIADADMVALLRSIGQSTLSEAWLEQADDLIARVNEDRGGDFSRFVAAMRTKVPNAALDDEANPSRESVGQLLKAYDKAKRAEEIQY